MQSYLPPLLHTFDKSYQPGEIENNLCDAAGFTLHHHVRDLCKEDEGKTIVKVLPLQRSPVVSPDRSHCWELFVLSRYSEVLKEKHCIVCDKLCLPLFCSKCGAAFYCSRACQINHWTIHKLNCDQLIKPTRSFVYDIQMWVTSQKPLKPDEEPERHIIKSDYLTGWIVWEELNKKEKALARRYLDK